MNPTLSIRPARAGDAPTLARIMGETFLADQARYIPEPLDPASIRDYSRALTARRWQAIALAELDGTPAGMIYAEAPRSTPSTSSPPSNAAASAPP
ncbi:MAG: hypothetical protein WD749_00945 [Phycisphaerales bacterium]